MRQRHPALRPLLQAVRPQAEAADVQFADGTKTFSPELDAIYKAFDQGERLRQMADRSVAERKRQNFEAAVTATIFETRLPFMVEAARRLGRESVYVYDIDNLREIRHEVKEPAQRRLPLPEELRGAAHLVYERCARAGLSPSIALLSEHGDKGVYAVRIPCPKETHALLGTIAAQDNVASDNGGKRALHDLESEAVAQAVKTLLPKKIRVGVEADQRTIDVYYIDFKREIENSGSHPAQTKPTIAPAPGALRGAARILYDYCEALGLSPRVMLWCDLEADRAGSKIVIPVPSALIR